MLVQGAFGYAKTLQKKGVSPGEVVIIILNHSQDLIFAFWGAILHGAIPAIMPFLTEKLSPEHYRQSLVSLIEISKPAAIITYPEFQVEVDLALLQLAGANSSVRAVISTSMVETAVTLNQNSLLSFHSQPEETVLLQHSSGSTGLQKGVALSHQSIFNQLESYTKAIDLTEKDVIVSWLPLYHDMGLIAGFILPILYSVPLVLISPFDWVRSPVLLLQAVTKYTGTLTWLPNFAFNFCARKIRNRELDQIELSSWRAIINCSEPMYLISHQLFQERFSAFGLRSDAISTCYAMAENVFGVTQTKPGTPVTVDRVEAASFVSQHIAKQSPANSASMTFLSAGKPLENVRVQIFSPDYKPLDDRKVGEIAIQSNCLLKEYYHRPDLSESAFFAGWYLSGDLGYIAEGEVFVTGRKKDLIIVGGKNIYPQDLENLANEVQGIHPGRTAALGIFNPDSGTEDIVLIAEMDEDFDPDPEYRDKLANAIRLKINQGSDVSVRLVKFVPRGWLLKTSSGKISRSANKEKYLIDFGSH